MNHSQTLLLYFLLILSLRSITSFINFRKLIYMYYIDHKQIHQHESCMIFSSNSLLNERHTMVIYNLDNLDIVKTIS